MQVSFWTHEGRELTEVSGTILACEDGLSRNTDLPRSLHIISTPTVLVRL